jgi:hypothetical protein
MPIEGAEGAIGVAHVGIVNVPVDEVRDVFLWIVLKSHILGEASHLMQVKEVPGGESFSFG